MKSNQLLIVAVLSMSIATPALAQPDGAEGQGDIEMFAGNGLAAGAAEGVLPGGAIVHVRLNNLEQLLQDASDMAMHFIPEKTAPPNVKPMFEMKNPLLAIMGMEAMGAPMTTDQLGAMLGLHMNQPVTISWYPQIGPDAVVVSLPMKNPTTLTAMVANITRADSITKKQLDGGETYFWVSCNNPDLPSTLRVVCSDDRAYITTTTAVVQMLHAKPGQGPPPLKASALLQRCMKTHAGDDLAIMIDPATFKPALPQLAQFGQLPPDFVEGVRDEILQSIPPEEREVIDMQLRSNLGIRDIHEALDYVEAVATAGYEVVFAALLDEAKNFDGILIGANLSEGDQSVRVSLLSKNIKQADWTSSLPISDIKTHLATLPGDKHFVQATGKQPPVKTSALIDAFLSRVKEKLTADHLESETLDAIAAYFTKSKPQQPLTTKADWTITARTLRAPEKSIRDFNSFEAYVNDLFYGSGISGGAWDTIQAMPRMTDDALAAHFKDNADIANANDAAYRALMAYFNRPVAFYDKISQSRREEVEGDVNKLISENRYITRSGFFGYNQHELINRKFFLYRHAGKLTYLHDGGDRPDLLASIGKTPAAKLPASLDAMFKNAPDGTNRVEMTRLGNTPIAAVNYLEEVEALVHREMNAYLAAARNIVRNAPNREAALAKLDGLDMPMTISELKVDAQTNELFLVTPIDLTFPRPRVLPELKKLLKDYEAKADEVGGTALFTAVQPGEMNFKLVFNSKGLGLLVRSTINNAFTTYGSSPEAQQRFENLMTGPHDHNYWEHETLWENPMYAAPDFGDDFEFDEFEEPKQPF